MSDLSFDHLRAGQLHRGTLLLRFNQANLEMIMPKAYWVSSYQAIHDAEKLAAYAKIAGPAVTGAGGRFLTRGVAAKAFEAGKVERTVVIEFPSLEAAIAAHDTPEYQAALEALGDGVTRDLRVVEGVE